jgi:hypothetical protein
MAFPTTVVEICFDETPVAGNGFTLDDTTKGVLNNPYYFLDTGLNFTDVSADVQQVSISRGRSRQLDQYQSGTAQIDFINKNRKYDPLNSASPYSPNIVPRKYIRVKSNGISIFGGIINDWSLSYEIPQNSYVTAFCSDGFSLLANQTITGFTPSAESSGSRIRTILDRPEITFLSSNPISIDTGVSTMGAFAISDATDALSYLRQVERSEQGFFYFTANNTLRFKGRDTVLAQVGSVSFADDGTGTSNYMSLDVATGDELLFNRIVAQSPAGSAQTVSDTVSISKYDTISLYVSDLLNSTTAEVLSIANLYLQQYSNPEVRFTGVSQQLGALSSTNQDKLLTLDLTDLVTVTRTFDSGVPTSVTRYGLIEGITHTIRPQNHMISYRLGQQVLGNFILDSATFGKLDTGIIN